MSSVLKALKNQSSPLVQATTDVSIQTAKATQSRFGYAVIAVIIFVVAGAGAWLLMQWLMAAPEPVKTVTEMQQPAPTYQLGPIAPVITPKWPTSDVIVAADQPVVTESQQPVVSAAQQQAQNTVVNSNQAIDLSQVSPELLSAFESALNETANPAGNQRAASVVPLLTQLNINFQRTVPSFSYDGHQYSSRAQSRWVELSGVRLFEGERFQGLSVLTIAPAHVVLAKDN